MEIKLKIYYNYLKWDTIVFENKKLNCQCPRNVTVSL